MEDKGYKKGESGKMIRTLWIILPAIFLKDFVTGNLQNTAAVVLLFALIAFTLFKGHVYSKRNGHSKRKHGFGFGENLAAK